MDERAEIKFPPHKGGLFLAHNEHLNYYESAADWFYDGADRRDDAISYEEYLRCIETNEVWVLRWYPDTPVGFCRVIGATLEVVLAASKEAR